MKTAALAIALLASAPLSIGAAQAQAITNAPAVAPGNALLTVTGEGTSKRAPDLAVFTAGVTSQGKTAGEALSANSADMGKVIAALKRAGIADRDIQTSNLSLNPIYAPQRPLPDGSVEPQEPRIVGYQANNSVTVRQRRLGEFGKVIDTLVNAGANQVNGPNFMVDEPDPALDEARSEAVKKARERANLYARAAGLKVLRIVSISESSGYGPPMPVYQMAKADRAGNAVPVEAGEVALTANVTVQFELAP